MTLEEILRRVAKDLRSHRLQNEEHTKLAAILPILRALGWDETNTEEFMPEYPVDNGRVDYALFNPKTQTPMVFVEAKRHGNASEQGEEQLFTYASNQGIPFLVLTDGDSWNFYLSMASGSWSERKFYQFSVQRCDEHDKDDKTEEYANFFRRYLAKERVISEEARRDAEELRANTQEKKRARNAIPGVWRTLLEKPNETLSSFVADAVGAEKGIRPELDDVEDFLRRQIHAGTHGATPSIRPSQNNQTRPETNSLKSGNEGKNSAPKRITGYTLDGHTEQTRSSTGTLVEILKEFQNQDPAFIQTFHERTKSNSRRLVAKSRKELYDKSHLMKHSKPLSDGWWVGTNISTIQVENYIKIACEIRGVSVKLIWS